MSGFKYTKATYRFISNYKDGKWDDGELTTDENILMNESAGVIQYAQTVFEGLKAYRTPSDKIMLFRPIMHARRLNKSAEVLGMPEYPTEKFMEAVIEVVKANKEIIPRYGEGELYIRPTMFSTQPILGIKPAQEYQFRVFVSPVTSYFNTREGVNLCVSKYDSAAPNGTGHVKCGLNYAMSMQAIADAKKNGYDDCVYLDPATHTKIEEASSANIIFVDDKGNIVVPKSKTVLQSITRQSIVEAAKSYGHMEVVEREVFVNELHNMKECFLCGTAATITPVKTLTFDKYTLKFNGAWNEEWVVTPKLIEMMRKIKMGSISDRFGWLVIVE